MKGKPVDEARQEIAENAVKIGAKYLFFVGDDVVCPGHTFRQLIYRMENNPSIGVCGGVYCAKCDPSYPLVLEEMEKAHIGIGRLVNFSKSPGLGMDCTLIRVYILETLSQTLVQNYRRRLIHGWDKLRRVLDRGFVLF